MFILIVDNNRFYVSVLKEMLHKAGFNHIGNLDNGIECILQLNRDEIPDVILIDESQCYVNDVNVLKNIHNVSPGLTVVILSAAKTLVNASVKPERGSTVYISKECVTAENLPKILNTIFSEKAVVTKKSTVSKAISLFRKSFAATTNL